MVRNPFANAENTGSMGLIPGLGRSPGGGNGNKVYSSCLKNPMDFLLSSRQRRLMGYSPWGHKELYTTEHAERAI